MDNQQLKHYWGIFIIVCILTGAIGAGVVIRTLNNSSAPAPSAIVPAQLNEGSETESLPRFSLADVAEHADASSCYMAAYGNVYDVTPYVTESTHPGGQGTLLSGCGKEMTSMFDRIHSDGAKAELEEFLIGVLADA